MSSGRILPWQFSTFGLFSLLFVCVLAFLFSSTQTKYILDDASSDVDNVLLRSHLNPIDDLFLLDILALFSYSFVEEEAVCSVTFDYTAASWLTNFWLVLLMKMMVVQLSQINIWFLLKSMIWLECNQVLRMAHLTLLPGRSLSIQWQLFDTVRGDGHRRWSALSWCKSEKDQHFIRTNWGRFAGPDQLTVLEWQIRKRCVGFDFLLLPFGVWRKKRKKKKSQLALCIYFKGNRADRV